MADGLRSNVRSKLTPSHDIGLPTKLKDKIKIASCNVVPSSIRLARHDGSGALSATEAAQIESDKANTRRRAKQGRLTAFQREIKNRVAVEHRRSSPEPEPAKSNWNLNQSEFTNKENNNACPASMMTPGSSGRRVRKPRSPPSHGHLKQQIGRLAMAEMVHIETLRRYLLEDADFQRALSAVIGSAMLSQQDFDALFIGPDGMTATRIPQQQVFDLLLGAHSQSNAPKPRPTGVVAHNPDILGWARDRLSSCLQKQQSPTRSLMLSQGVRSGSIREHQSPVRVGQVLIDVHEADEVDSPEADELEQSECLEDLIEQEMAEQSQFLFKIARQREQGRAQVQPSHLCLRLNDWRVACV